jgi:hypothetical protein
MGSGVDVLGMDRPSVGWEYLEVPAAAYCCLLLPTAA